MDVAKFRSSYKIIDSNGGNLAKNVKELEIMETKKFTKPPLAVEFDSILTENNRTIDEKFITLVTILRSYSTVQELMLFMIHKMASGLQ